MVYGAALPVLTASYTGLVNGDTAASLTTPPILSTTATPGSPVSQYPITIAGAVDPDYTIGYVSGILTVTRAPLTITADSKHKVYGDANPGLTGSMIGVKNNDAITASFTTSADATSAVGDHGIAAHAVDGSPDHRLGNYDVTLIDGTLTVTPAPLTVTPDNASRTYGDPNPSFTGRIEGLKNNDAITASYGTSAGAASDAGTYAITSTLDDPTGRLGNYAVTLNQGTLTVGKATLTVTPDNLAKTYGDMAFLTGRISGQKNSDTFSASYASDGAAAAADVGSGSYPITVANVSGAKLANYDVIRNTGTLTINQAPLTVTPASAWRFTVDPDTTFTGTLSPTRNGDIINAVYGVVGDHSLPGLYPITATLSGARLPNYAVTYNQGTLEVVKPATLSGLVFADTNNDGQVDFGEHGIPGVAITLAGTDDLGRAITIGKVTDSDGAYVFDVFDRLRPGTYRVTESQPAGYNSGINSVGTVNGTVDGTIVDQALDQIAGITLGKGDDGINYNFGERPTSGSPLQHGQTAGIGFWNNKNGQALIKSLNGSAGATALGNWLATTFPNMFGTSAGSNNLTAATNTQVATFFQSKFNVKYQKLDAQVLATALAVYVTKTSLAGGTYAAPYGFLVSDGGTDSATWSVGTDGAAFDVANGTTLTIMDFLLATDRKSRGSNGNLYSGNATLRTMANDAYSAINQNGGIN
jgi:hypothetical protein